MQDNKANNLSVADDDENSQDKWMIRPCSVYSDEYRECKSWKGRFHQLYISGERYDCAAWKEDFDRCTQFKLTNSRELAEQLINSEKKRRLKRIQNARNNDVWEYRKSPPEDWNAPLPESLERMKLPDIQYTTHNMCTIL